MREMTLTALPGLPEVAAGADLPKLLNEAIGRAGKRLEANDVLVVAQKVVSKCEGRVFRLADVRISAEARRVAAVAGKDARLVQLILDESREVLRVAPGVLIVEHRLGFVMANAGVDQSNLPGSSGGEAALLLPRDPDASARVLRKGLLGLTGVDAGIVINDSFGRAWRKGVCGIALGVSGMPALVDARGQPDRAGRPLRVTEIAAADELAAAASLLMGQAAEGLPAVMVRGFPYARRESGVAELLRPREQDLFR